MENLITDSIKLIEEGLAPLIERIHSFEFTSKNKHSEEELNLIIKRIEALPKYTKDELNSFVEELNEFPQHTEDELIAFIEHLKESPKKNENQLIDEIKALKYQPKSSIRGRSALNLHLKCLPEYTEKELSLLMEYIKIFPLEIEMEINTIIKKIQTLPLHIDGNTYSFFKYFEDKELSEQTQDGLINFFKRIALIKHLHFLESIKHLEKESKEQLFALTRIIKKHIPNCAMIILFGSYARGTEVIYDETIENGCRVSFQSDFDIMVVMPRPTTEANAAGIEMNASREITAEYDKRFLRSPHVAPPQFIVESEDVLRENLKIHQPFFSDIVKEGIVLYDNGKISLPKVGKLSWKVKKELAQENFEKSRYGDAFLDGGYFYFNRDNYIIASFQLHQACERYYRVLGMVFVNYNPKLHDLEKFIERTSGFSPELSTVFPRVTSFEDETFKLLRDAYIDSRYNDKFVVTKEELEYMLERVEVLKEITYRICPKQIEYYDRMAKEKE